MALATMKSFSHNGFFTTKAAPTHIAKNIIIIRNPLHASSTFSGSVGQLNHMPHRHRRDPQRLNDKDAHSRGDALQLQAEQPWTSPGNGSMKIRKKIDGHAQRSACHPPTNSAKPAKNGSIEIFGQAFKVEVNRRPPHDGPKRQKRQAPQTSAAREGNDHVAPIPQQEQGE